MMSRVVYYLLLYPLSLLPRFIRYALSDFFRVLVAGVFGYRKRVVQSNIRMAFPDLPESKIRFIANRFYVNLFDIIVESIHHFSANPQKISGCLHQVNPEILDDADVSGKQIIMCGGHYCNWELWGFLSPLKISKQVTGIYQPLRDRFLDGKMRVSRERTGLKMLPMREVGIFMKNNHNKDGVLVFGFDQSPSNPNRAAWIQFMGIETAAMEGPEFFAKKFNLPVAYGHLKRVSRGKYEIRYEWVTKSPNVWEPSAITRRLYQILEEDIRTVPEWWLWSHRRWKHKRSGN